MLKNTAALPIMDSLEKSEIKVGKFAMISQVLRNMSLAIDSVNL